MIIDDDSDASTLQKFRSIRRRPLRVSQPSLVKRSYFTPENRFPLVIQPETDGIDLVEWTRAARDLVEEELLKHGAILFRGFNLSTVERFSQFARMLSPNLLDYRERAAPRIEVDKNIYTSTEYPADQSIPLHHEMSYSHNWPMKLWFFCVTPAQSQGATPIVDDRVVFQQLDPLIKKRFMEKKVMYTRNYSDGLDLSWQDVFQTTDKSVVEEYCHRAHTEFEWDTGSRLRTRQVRQAVVTHPRTGETVWFNHAHMFHVSNLQPEVRESLLKEFTEDYLPRNAYYGDGSAIEDSVLDEIRETYNRAATVFQWQEGDVLLLDNILASHGRQPYVGPRKILVAMAELFTNEIPQADFEI